MELELITAEVQTSIATILKERGMSRKQLSRDLDVSYETIRKVEAGLTDHPRFDVVAGIIKRAGRSVDQFIGIETPPAEAATAHTVPATLPQPVSYYEDTIRALSRTVNHLLNGTSNYTVEHSLSAQAMADLRPYALSGHEDREGLLSLALSVITRLMKDESAKDSVQDKGVHRKKA